MNLLLVEDHPLMRFGLEAALTAAVPDARITVADGPAAALIALNRAPRPDIVLLDLRLPTLAAGITLLRQIRKVASTCRVIALSGETDPQLIPLLQADGAMGFVSKSDGPEVLLAAIDAVRRGQPCFHTASLAPLPADSLRGRACPDMIPRVWQVYALLAQGLPNKLIGRELDITEGAVKNYVTRLLEAVDARNRSEAIALYRENIDRWRVDPAYRGR